VEKQRLNGLICPEKIALHVSYILDTKENIMINLMGWNVVFNLNNLEVTHMGLDCYHPLNFYIATLQ